MSHPQLDANNHEIKNDQLAAQEVLSMKTPRDSLSFQYEKPRSCARSH
jgi:hypothetical protein